MSVTIGALTFGNLQAVPLAYREDDTINGLTAKQWQITGLLTPAEYVSLLSIYDAWRDLKLSLIHI